MSWTRFLAVITFLFVSSVLVTTFRKIIGTSIKLETMHDWIANLAAEVLGLLMAYLWWRILEWAGYLDWFLGSTP